MGINPTRYKVTAFVIGAFFAGIAGGTLRASQTISVAARFRFHEEHRHRGDGDSRRNGADTRRDRSRQYSDDLPESLRTFAEYRMIIYSLLIIGLMICVRKDCSRSANSAGPKHECAVAPTRKCDDSFGGFTAVSKLDLHIGEHELVGLIGPNGAGKTTVFNLITGVYQPTEGAIQFLAASQPLA